MFEHFTFAAQAQSSPPHVESESTSPTNISFPSPASPEFPFQWENKNQNQNQHRTQTIQNPSSIDTISQKFAIQSLSPSPSPTLSNEHPHPSLWPTNPPSPIIDFDNEETTFNPAELSYISTTRGMSRIHADFSTPYTTTTNDTLANPKYTLATRRLVRQRNVHLQSNPTHVRDIESLVEGMIERNLQCQLRKSRERERGELCSPPPSRGGLEEVELEREQEQEREYNSTANHHHPRNPNDSRDSGNERDSNGEDMDLDILSPFDRPITPDLEDEGFGDDEEMEMVAVMREEVACLRRSGTPGGIRKMGGRYRGGEMIGGGMGKGGGLGMGSGKGAMGGLGLGLGKGGVTSNVKVVDGKVKVRCLPRMRKRSRPVLNAGVGLE